jgi:hypothetical protein
VSLIDALSCTTLNPPSLVLTQHLTIPKNIPQALKNAHSAIEHKAMNVKYIWV